jgi:signal transduction histidine kinase
VTSDDEKTFPGLGMGLYISHEIVRRHGGTMEVKSIKGCGSVFRVTLPYGDGAAPDRPEGSQ